MAIEFTSDELSSIERLLFPENEVVEFICLSADEDVKWKNIALNCQIVSPSHKGRKHYVRIPMETGDNPFKKKRKAFFLTAFWSTEELKAAQKGEFTLVPSRCVGKRFTAVAERPWGTDPDKQNQDFTRFKVTGEGPTDDSVSTGDASHGMGTGGVDNIPF